MARIDWYHIVTSVLEGTDGFVTELSSIPRRPKNCHNLHQLSVYNLSKVPRHIFALIGICVLTLFTGIGVPAITDSDEAFYAESAREMIESGDWLTPRFNYVPRFEKPILYYWLTAISYTVAGVSEAAARFPSALAGLGLTLLTFGCARRMYDATTSLLAGMITATSFGYIAMAHQALPDLPLAFFVTLTTWASIEGLLSWPDRELKGPKIRRNRPWLLTAAIGAAGGLLIKGPVGLALPLIVIASIVTSEYLTNRSRFTVRSTDLVLAILFFLLLSIPWYLAMTVEHGVTYLDRFFVAENIERFATARYNDPRPLWYYIPIVLGGMLPWSPFMLLWLPLTWKSARQHRVDISTLRLVIWSLAPLLFYTISIGKQPRYILPILPPLAILLAMAIRRALNDRSVHIGLFSVCGTVTALLMLGIGVLIHRTRPLLLEWSATATIVVSGMVILSGLVLLIAVLMSWRSTSLAKRLRNTIPLLITACAAITAIGAHYVVLATPGPAPVERMAILVDEARQANERYGRHGVFNRNLVFYTNTKYVELPILDAARDFLLSSDRVFCIMTAEDATSLEAAGVHLSRLEELSYLNTGNLNFRTLLDPDPDQFLKQVVLVSNR